MVNRFDQSADAGKPKAPVAGLLFLLTCAIIPGALGSLILGPWLQPFWFHVFYNNIGFWTALGAFVGLFVIALPLWYAGSRWALPLGVALSGAMLLGWLIVYGIWAGDWTAEKVFQSLSYGDKTTLPETSGVRFIPQKVARIYAESRLQEPEVRLADHDTLIQGDRFDWTFTRVPRDAWRGHADGYAVVDGAGVVTMVRQQMKYGEGMLGRDDITWRLRQERYWSTLTDIFYLQRPDAGVVAIAPYVDYSFRFPVMVPHWGGVFIVHASGGVERLDANAAIKHPLLANQRIFPQELTRLHVEAYAKQYRTEIPDTSVEGLYSAQMPYLVPTSAGQRWFVATVPEGGGGLSHIFMVDATTGRIEVQKLPLDSALVGPVRAAQYVQGFGVVIEPRPIVKNGALYWMFTVTPPSFAGVYDTVLVNAQTLETQSFGNRPERLVGFLRGEPTAPVSQAAQQALALSPQNLRQTIEQLERALEALKELERRGSAGK